tara:strand:+ start:110 stop:724 length:615 start_codon:yes stop_codon:yes gene_type:complete
MLLSNTDINVCINKYIHVYDILLLRKSYKKYNNFKIYKYHDLIRTIKLYSKFNINPNDNYKIELIIQNNIKYINEDTIEVLKNNGIKDIDTIKIEKLTSYNNLEETIIHMNNINKLLRILIKNYIIYNLDIYIYYICLDYELLYNFKNILIYINDLPTDLDYYINNKNDIINSIHRYLFNNDYIVKDYYINEYNMVYIIFNKLD